MKNYSMIRSKAQEERCTNKGSWGSPLYCKCGCQTPLDTDPNLNLDGVTVSGKDNFRDAYYILLRNGLECGGRISIQNNYIVLDSVEYLGVERSFIQHLIDAARAINTTPKVENAGSTFAETVAFERMADKLDIMEQDDRNINNSGYCTKCHSYCFGDCEANE